MTEEQQETIVNEALRKLCDYINAWWDFEPINKDEPGPYKVEQFTTTDYDRNLYGETNWTVLEPDIIRIVASDGDDGGPNTLIVGLDEVFRAEAQISWIVHVFDTMPVMMWTQEDGMRMPPAGDFKKEDKK